MKKMSSVIIIIMYMIIVPVEMQTFSNNLAKKKISSENVIKLPNIYMIVEAITRTVIIQSNNNAYIHFS